MRRTIFLLAGVLLAMVALGSDSPKEYDDRVEMNGIEGEWNEVTLKTNGAELGGDFHMIFRRRKYTRTRPGFSEDGVYRVDPYQKPAQLDWTVTCEVDKDHNFKGIYKIDGDTLTIAWFQMKDERPNSFSQADILVFTLKRVRK